MKELLSIIEDYLYTIDMESQNRTTIYSISCTFEKQLVSTDMVKNFRNVSKHET